MPETIVPDLQAALICEDVRQEMNPASQTLVGVLSCLQSPQFPVAVLKLCVWVRWCAGQGDFHQKTRLIAPDESTVIQESDVMFQLLDPNANVTNVAIFPGVQFAEAGLYSLEIFVDDDLKLRMPFPVIQISGQQQGSAGNN